MRSAVTILSVVLAVAAEAPYHLPRPAPHAPSFGYPSGSAPPTRPPPHLAPFPQLPQPRPAPQPFIPSHPAPQLLYTPSQGYNYQQPSFGPAFVHPAPQPAPQPIPVYNPPPPVHLPASQPQPLPIAYPQPIPVTYPQPQPQPIPVSQPRPQPVHIPQPSYGLPPPQPQLHYQPQPQPQPAPQPQPLPNYIYNLPQAPAAPLASQPAPVFPQSQGYAYQQPIFQPQFTAQLPLQSQPLTNNAVSSYQADSNQYSTAQARIHEEALDQTVVSRVQDIIKDSEHTSAKNAGYLSLVSGVSLESAKPSIEISSFVHNSPLSVTGAGLIDVRSSSGSASSSSSASVSSSYDAPTVPVGSSQSGGGSASLGFLPNTKPGNSYGISNELELS